MITNELHFRETIASASALLFLVNYQPLVRVQCLAHRCTDIALYILVQHPWAKLIKSAASSASCSNHRCHQDIIPDQITFT